ncbi:hypothetical protein GUJ93_ZPchr0008g12972 [Zizania palustris]|uniref:Peroxidase 1 n=1 Tax=Zizania palustris TaxID=103762 RepID=A0A8J5UVU0_ZIZPA|nr:hypothetical protein GUJ93_ZPchr0008g12972 [Zizania palustris]
MASSCRLAGLVLLLVAALASTLPAACRAQLQVGFYDTRCPNAELLVRQAVTAAVANNSGLAAGLVRLHFHDCFVRGCDASVLLITNGTAERDAPPNFPSLRGFEVIDAAKAAIERSCPRTVSCADILAFAARDAVALSGNVTYKVPAGRRDGNISIDTDTFTNLPGPNSTATELIENFARKNLNAEEMVILSGAHSIGRSNCTSFFERNRERLASGTISSAYQALLEVLCSPPVRTADMDVSTPTVLDNNYYKLLPLKLGLFFSDDQLIRNNTLVPLVNAFAANETLWKERFTAAMIKMGNIEVLTENAGNIRLNCNVLNTRSSSSAEMIETLFPAAGDEVAAT